jgi:hypothetical protein
MSHDQFADSAAVVTARSSWVNPEDIIAVVYPHKDNEFAMLYYINSERQPVWVPVDNLNDLNLPEDFDVLRRFDVNLSLVAGFSFPDEASLKGFAAMIHFKPFMTHSDEPKLFEGSFGDIEKYLEMRGIAYNFGNVTINGVHMCGLVFSPPPETIQIKKLVEGNLQDGFQEAELIDERAQPELDIILAVARTRLKSGVLQARVLYLDPAGKLKEFTSRDIVGEKIKWPGHFLTDKPGFDLNTSLLTRIKGQLNAGPYITPETTLSFSLLPETGNSHSRSEIILPVPIEDVLNYLKQNDVVITAEKSPFPRIGVYSVFPIIPLKPKAANAVVNPPQPGMIALG